jgi:hypothetical protein
VTTANNWTYSAVSNNSLNIKIGDVFEMKVWSNQTDTQLDYYALVIYPTRICGTKQGTIIKDLTFGWSPTISHTLSQGRLPTANVNASHGTIINTPQGINVTSTINLQIPASSQGSTDVSVVGTLVGQLCTYYGDYGLRATIGFRQHASNHPYYEKNNLPSTITFREISL